MTLLDKHGLPNVTILSQTKLTHTDTVYNFEVDDFHTYHIGEFGVWVHNADCCDFIIGGDSTAVSIKNMSQQEIIGIQRELNVTHITGGKLAKIINKNGHLEDMPIRSVDGRILTGIDIIGKNGEYISVGGPAKGSTPEKLAETLRKLQILKSEAEKNGTKAMVYYERGNSEKFQRLIEESKKILGKENVVIFDK